MMRRAGYLNGAPVRALADLDGPLWILWEAACQCRPADNEEGPICPICLEPLDPDTDPAWPGGCGHRLHQSCLDQMRDP